MSAALAELDRRLSNVIRPGRIAELDEAAALVKVETGGLVTDWLPWFTLRAGPDRTWWAPEVGEQVMLLAPSGELSQAVALAAWYQDAFPAAGNSKDKHRTVYSDGAVIEYDRAANLYTIDLTACAGSVVVKCRQATVEASDSVTLDTPETTCTGHLTVQAGVNVQGGVTVAGGDVTADGVGLKTHHHTEQGDGAPTTAAQA